MEENPYSKYQQTEEDAQTQTATPAAKPVEASGDPYSKYKTEDENTNDTQPEKPGVVARYATGLANSVGIPTTREGVEAAAPHIPKTWKEAGSTAADLLGGPAVAAGKMLYHEGEKAVQGVKDVAKESTEAGENIAEGGPVASNIGKIGSSVLKAGVQQVPFIGEPTQRAGENIHEGNYAGAAGELTGVGAQLVAESAHADPLTREVVTSPVRGAAKSYNVMRKAAPYVAPAAGLVEGGVRLMHGDPAGAVYSAIGGGTVGRIAKNLPEAGKALTEFGKRKPTDLVGNEYAPPAIGAVPEAKPAGPLGRIEYAEPTPARAQTRVGNDYVPPATEPTPAAKPAGPLGRIEYAEPTPYKPEAAAAEPKPAAVAAKPEMSADQIADEMLQKKVDQAHYKQAEAPAPVEAPKAAPAAKDIAEYHNKNRGFTYNMEQGFVKDKPVFSVAGEHPDLEEVIPGQNISTEQVQKYMDRPDVKEALKDPQKSVGGWFDGKGSHLEVSRLFTDKDAAIAAGKDLNQVEIYDHANKTGIPTGGTGEAPAPAEAPKVPEAPKAEEPKAAEEAPKGGIADHTSDEAQDFEHNVNKGNNPMGPDSLRQMREFAAENTDKPVKFLNEGQEATVFDLGNGKVLRISKGEAPNVPDLPEALKPESTKEVEGATGKFHATVSPKVSTEGISHQDVLDMTKKLSDKGYTWDATEANLGKTPDGEVKVIDAGAIKKNVAAEGNTDVENIIKDHGEQNLIKAGKEYDVNHEDYDFAKRDANRHRVDRDRFAKDVASKVPEAMVQKLLKAEQAFDDADDPMFTDAERSSASRATRAKAIWDAAHEGGVAEHMAAKGPAPEATTETAKMSNAELLKKGFTQDDIDAGLNLPKAGGAAEGKNVTGIPDEMSRLLTKEEREGISKSQVGATNAVNKLMKLPKVQEFVDIALQGEGGRKWYQRSSQAFEALKQALPEYFKEAGDKDKFLNLLASSSPQQSVKMNLQETLHVWSKYVDQGRPTGKALESMLNKEFTLKEAKTPNAMKALAGEDMWPDITKNNAFKAPSFGANLRGWLNHVTNDGWMAKFGGMTAAELSNPSSYHPLSVATRAAAEALGWEPAEAQAAIWAFTKAFDEHGETDPEMIKQYSSDFADLIAHDTDIQKQLEELGVNKEILNEHHAKVEPKPEVTGRTTPTTADSVARLGERIKRAKEQGRETAPKDQPELALTEGTEFNPNEPEKPKGDHPEVKKPVEFRRPEDTENHVKMKELGKPKKKSALGKTR